MNTAEEKPAAAAEQAETAKTPVKKRDKKGGGEHPAEGKMTLPRSGLASSVLGEVDARRADAAETTTPSGPDRLYSFTDRIQKEGERAASLRRESEEFETWVTFTLAGETYGLPVTHVQEILRVTTITRVPHAPYPVRGVTNMRGRVLPIVDLRLRLGLAEVEINDLCRILVVSSRGRLLGLLVDSVQQVLRLLQSGIEPPPPDIMTSRSDYIKGVYNLQGNLVIMLEVEKILLLPDRH